MLENFSDLNVVGQDNSSCSLPKNNTNEEKKISVVRYEGCNIVESTYRSILDELIDDAILGLCFEVHRNVKLSQTSKENNSEKNFSPNHVVSCPICQTVIGNYRFSGHLSRCMGVGTKRRASQNFKESDDDEESEDEDFIPGAVKKRSKKTNRPVRKPFEFPEAGKEFFTENCGVISKQTEKLCTKTLNCTLNTDEQRQDVRNDIFRNKIDQITNEEVIDVDTVDESIGQQFSMPS